MQVISIFGTTGTGKSLFADYLEAKAKLSGLSVAVSDHELFTSDKNYEKLLNKIKDDHRTKNIDVSILVINDALENMRVDFGGSFSYSLFCKFFPK